MRNRISENSQIVLFWKTIESVPRKCILGTGFENRFFEQALDIASNRIFGYPVPEIRQSVSESDIQFRESVFGTIYRYFGYLDFRVIGSDKNQVLSSNFLFF